MSSHYDSTVRVLGFESHSAPPLVLRRRFSRLPAASEMDEEQTLTRKIFGLMNSLLSVFVGDEMLQGMRKWSSHSGTLDLAFYF